MWEQIRSNQRRSMFVVTGMGVLLVATGVALGTLLAGDADPYSAALFGAVLGIVVWFVLWLVSVKSGDRVLLRIAGAQEIEKKDHPQLFNVVEEMTIAAALPRMPRVFVVDDPSPNAFATGRDPRWAGVTVTTGLLKILDRDELQGVVAHEVGHIKNRDVALMTTAGVMAGAIVLLGEIGLRAVWLGGGRRSRSDSKGGGGLQAVLMVLSLVLLVLAPVFAQLIYFALSRRREYLADASGAMFTRYPAGLASALHKLGGSHAPLKDKSRVTAPMYIVRPLRAAGRRAASLLSTHPPLEERIRILRTMAGGADYGAYEAAFGEVNDGQHVIGARTLGATAAVEARAASAEPISEPETVTQRARAASDAYLSGAGYIRRECGSCGAVLKVPPGLADRIEQCPRCNAQL